LAHFSISVEMAVRTILVAPDTKPRIFFAAIGATDAAELRPCLEFARALTQHGMVVTVAAHARF